jgi:deuterolysin
VLPFAGVYVNYKRTGLTPDMFQTIAPGETVTTSVNAAKSYKLAGVKTAKVSAVQSFKYVTGTKAPTALKDLSACDAVSSDVVAITPDQTKVAR